MAIARQRAAVWVYTVVLLGTLAWSLFEVNFNFWQREPRLLTLIVLGVWLLLPWVRRKLALPDGKLNGSADSMAPCVLVLAGVFIMFIAAFQPVGVQGSTAFAADTLDAHATSVAGSDWMFYGRTPHGDRYAPLDQINTGNVKHLSLA